MKAALLTTSDAQDAMRAVAEVLFEPEIASLLDNDDRRPTLIWTHINSDDYVSEVPTAADEKELTAACKKWKTTIGQFASQREARLLTISLVLRDQPCREIVTFTLSKATNKNRCVVLNIGHNVFNDVTRGTGILMQYDSSNLDKCLRRLLEDLLTGDLRPTEAFAKSGFRPINYNRPN